MYIMSDGFISRQDYIPELTYRHNRSINMDPIRSH